MKRWDLKPEDAENRERWQTLIEIGNLQTVTRTGLRPYRCERREYKQTTEIKVSISSSTYYTASQR